MEEKCNDHIRETLEYARRLSILADTGEQDSKDNGCAVLYGIVRDCAYKIRSRAEFEREEHRLKGKWS